MQQVRTSANSADEGRACGTGTVIVKSSYRDCGIEVYTDVVCDTDSIDSQTTAQTVQYCLLTTTCKD
jgi:hypothetical protein